ncbi:MAG: Trk system potassium transporter TrkA [Planctomycetota bacterium]
MRIVLVSSGQIAGQFAAELSREHDISIVHVGEAGRSELDRLDVELIEGRGNIPAALGRAHTAQADHLIACSNSDETNIIACLTARQLGGAHTTCFLAKEEYVRTFARGDGEGNNGAPGLAIDHLVWPSQMLADKIEQILAVPGATDVGEFARGQISLIEYRLRAGLPLLDRPLMEIRALPPGVLVAAVTRGDDWFVPRGQSVLKEGDRVLFIGRAEAMHQLASWFSSHLEEERGGAIFLVGGGTVAFLLAKALERGGGLAVKLIEADAERCTFLAESLQRTLVLHGDGSDLDLLESEQVRYARALVAVTDKDEKNLLCSLLARQLGVPKVITRVTSAANGRLFERVGIDVPLSTRGAAMEAVLHRIRHHEVDLLATLAAGRGEVLEITLPETFTPTALKELRLPPDSLVAALVRSHEAIVPGGATLIDPGDHCLVICKAERVDEVREAFAR